jgi:hypothetical protein
MRKQVGSQEKEAWPREHFIPQDAHPFLHPLARFTAHFMVKISPTDSQSLQTEYQ